MSLTRVLKVLRKDLALGPRSPIFMYAIALPVEIGRASCRERV